MADVAVCPKCQGEKFVHTAEGAKKCDVCRASGIVWRADESEDVRVPDERLDLTFRE